MGNFFDPLILHQLLSEQNLVPTVKPWFGGDASYGPDTNDIELAMRGSGPHRRKSLAHETTHAVQYNLLFPLANQLMNQKNAGKTLSKEDAAFLDGVQKIYNQSFGTVGQFDEFTKPNRELSTKVRKTLSDMYQDTDTAYKQYRTSALEAPAWGVGHFSVPGLMQRQPNGVTQNPHMDATNAQEMSILLDLYKRSSKTERDAASENRRQGLKPSQFQNTPSLWEYLK